MKFIKTLLVLFSLSANAGLPPTSLIGRDSAEKNGFYPLSVPNAQSTRITGGALIETGNENILANPSFESNRSTTGYGWSVSGATVSLDTTNQIHGKNALSLSLSSTLNLNQSAATNVANTVGLQAVASVYIKSSLADVNVCSIINNVEDKCVQYNGTDTWVKIEIPFIFGATQNGIKIKTTSSTSGTVLLDNAFVGLSSPFQNVSGAKLVGTVTITGCASGWNTSSATFASFGAQTGCTYTTTGSAIAPSTNIPAIKFASLPAGDYRLEYEGILATSANGTSGIFQFSDGINTARESSTVYAGSSTSQSPGLQQSISYSNTQSNITLEIKGKSVSGSAVIYGTTSFPGVIKVWYFPPESKIYSQASQDVAYTNAGTITIGATTTAPTKGTIVTDRIMASRKGQNLIAEYQYEQSATGGAIGSGDYLFSLPSGLSFDSNIVSFFTGTVVASASSKSIVGYGRAVNNSATDGHPCTLIAYSSTQFRASCLFGSTDSFVSSTIYPLNLAVGFGFRLQAPIQGWQDYGVIVGSFAEVPTVPGQNNAEIFSVSYAGANAGTASATNCTVSPCNIDQIGNIVSTITRVSGGSYTMTLNKTYSTLKCTASATQIGVGYIAASQVACKACSSVGFGTGAAIDTAGTIYCQGIK